VLWLPLLRVVLQHCDSDHVLEKGLMSKLDCQRVTAQSVFRPCSAAKCPFRTNPRPDKGLLMHPYLAQIITCASCKTQVHGQCTGINGLCQKCTDTPSKTMSSAQEETPLPHASAPAPASAPAAAADATGASAAAAPAAHIAGPIQPGDGAAGEQAQEPAQDGEAETLHGADAAAKAAAAPADELDRTAADTDATMSSAQEETPLPHASAPAPASAPAAAADALPLVDQGLLDAVAGAALAKAGSGVSLAEWRAYLAPAAMQTIAQPQNSRWRIVPLSSHNFGCFWFAVCFALCAPLKDVQQAVMESVVAEPQLVKPAAAAGKQGPRSVAVYQMLLGQDGASDPKQINRLTQSGRSNILKRLRSHVTKSRRTADHYGGDDEATLIALTDAFKHVEIHSAAWPVRRGTRPQLITLGLAAGRRRSDITTHVFFIHTGGNHYSLLVHITSTGEPKWRFASDEQSPPQDEVRAVLGLRPRAAAVIVPKDAALAVSPPSATSAAGTDLPAGADPIPPAAHASDAQSQSTSSPAMAASAPPASAGQSASECEGSQPQSVPSTVAQADGSHRLSRWLVLPADAGEKKLEQWRAIAAAQQWTVAESNQRCPEEAKQLGAGSLVVVLDDPFTAVEKVGALEQLGWPVDPPICSTAIFNRDPAELDVQPDIGAAVQRFSSILAADTFWVPASLDPLWVPTSSAAAPPTLMRMRLLSKHMGGTLVEGDLGGNPMTHLLATHALCEPFYRVAVKSDYGTPGVAAHFIDMAFKDATHPAEKNHEVAILKHVAVVGVGLRGDQVLTAEASVDASAGGELVLAKTLDDLPGAIRKLERTPVLRVVVVAKSEDVEKVRSSTQWAKTVDNASSICRYPVQLVDLGRLDDVPQLVDWLSKIEADASQPPQQSAPAAAAVSSPSPTPLAPAPAAPAAPAAAAATPAPSQATPPPKQAKAPNRWRSDEGTRGANWNGRRAGPAAFARRPRAQSRLSAGLT